MITLRVVDGYILLVLALISVAAETQSSVDMVFPTHLWHRCTLTWISSIKLLFYRRHFAVRWVWFIVQYCAAPYSLEQITKSWTTLKRLKVAVGENLRELTRIYEFPRILSAKRPMSTIVYNPHILQYQAWYTHSHVQTFSWESWLQGSLLVETVGSTHNITVQLECNLENAEYEFPNLCEVSFSLKQWTIVF